jgi:hypothetical protein
MPVRKILEESAVSQEAARAMHTAFDSIVQALEQAGQTVQHTAVASYIARVADDCQYDASRIVEAMLALMRPQDL